MREEPDVAPAYVSGGCGRGALRACLSPSACRGSRWHEKAYTVGGATALRMGHTRSTSDERASHLATAGGVTSVANRGTPVTSPVRFLTPVRGATPITPSYSGEWRRLKTGASRVPFETPTGDIFMYLDGGGGCSGDVLRSSWNSGRSGSLDTSRRIRRATSLSGRNDGVSRYPFGSCRWNLCVSPLGPSAVQRSSSRRGRPEVARNLQAHDDSESDWFTIWERLVPTSEHSSPFRTCPIVDTRDRRCASMSCHSGPVATPVDRPTRSGRGTLWWSRAALRRLRCWCFERRTARRDEESRVWGPQLGPAGPHLRRLAVRTHRAKLWRPAPIPSPKK